MPPRKAISRSTTWKEGPAPSAAFPAFLAHRFPTAIVKFDDAAGAPLRGADGLCIPVTRGEAGEAIGKIAGGAARFEGYTDPAASEKKILRDVFSPGDAWLRTGDLMRQDAQGFFYFVDRIGDTFRWKGENVATTEVAAVAASAPGVTAANVYGVAVPGAGGKAGHGGAGSGRRLRYCRLPRPHDRACPPMRGRSSCASCRQPGHHRNLQAEEAAAGAGWLRSLAIGDLLYVDDGTGYVPLDAALYARINSGLMRL